MLQDQNGYTPFDPFGQDKDIRPLPGFDKTKLPLIRKGQKATYPVGTPPFSNEPLEPIDYSDPWTRFMKEWLEPMLGTKEKMETDPVGATGVAGEFYGDKIKEWTGFDLADIGIYIVVFTLILIAVFGLLLPSLQQKGEEAAKVIATT